MGTSTYALLTAGVARLLFVAQQRRLLALCVLNIKELEQTHTHVKKARATCISAMLRQSTILALHMNT
ncbi:hypothetical protein RA29_11230 [Tateyamaria sp. ANG-S1]|nr:hypothetical protein RA29_11230 [Tateyamaria sp. ANG-S1]